MIPAEEIRKAEALIVPPPQPVEKGLAKARPFYVDMVK